MLSLCCFKRKYNSIFGKECLVFGKEYVAPFQMYLSQSVCPLCTKQLQRGCHTAHVYGDVRSTFVIWIGGSKLAKSRGFIFKVNFNMFIHSIFWDIMTHQNNSALPLGPHQGADGHSRVVEKYLPSKSTQGCSEQVSLFSRPGQSQGLLYKHLCD